jgi:hypothetical protein
MLIGRKPKHENRVLIKEKLYNIQIQHEHSPQNHHKHLLQDTGKKRDSKNYIKNNLNCSVTKPQLCTPCSHMIL